MGARSSTRRERPDPGAPPATLALPPSGFAAGIYARSDIERGVHKAPANEVVRGITRFVTNVTYDRQSVLNPEGINALRFFEGRGNRVWGARTMSSDPEWKYVNVRRLFIYLEHSIDKSHPVGGLRAQQRAAVGVDPADDRGLPARRPGGPAP